MGVSRWLLLSLAIACGAAVAHGKATLESQRKAINDEDGFFWDRLLEDVGSSMESESPTKSPVAPTPAPVNLTPAPITPTPAPVVTTAAPTVSTPETPAPFTLTLPPVPTPSPVLPPTAAPTTGVCSLDVTVSCLDGNGIPCGDIVRPEGQCIVPIVYTYRLENIGVAELTISDLARSRAGETTNLLDSVAGANPLLPGDSVSTVENESLNLCVDGLYETTVVAEATPSDGPICEDTDMVLFEIVGATTPVPTPGPTTLAPSSSPSEPLTPVPTPIGTSSPTDDCDLFIEIGCLPPFFGADCNQIDTLITECQESPSMLVMRYTGGDCGGSFNIQPNTLFSCVDGSQNSPPVEEGTTSYIVAIGLEDDEVYFSGFVQVGDEFTLVPNSLIAENSNVLVYDPSDLTDPVDIVANGILLQNVTFHTSCEDFLFLKDRFGSVQLVEFENERQGLVTCFQDLTLTFTIELPEDGSTGPTDLTNLTILSNIENLEGEEQDLSTLVLGSQVTLDAPLVVQETFEIDLTQRRRYSSTATIVGQSDIGKICTGSNQYQFAAGNPLPPIFPTLSPTASPTITPIPTPDPDTAACEIEASITCSVADGRRCELRNPEGRTCIGTAPSLLQFMYDSGTTCNGENSAVDFECEDMNTEIERPTSVYVEMGEGDDDLWFTGEIDEGQIVDVPIGRSDTMSIRVYTVDEGSPGTLLQESAMGILCTEDSALSLMTYFGSMQLMGFRNAELGLEQVFANIEIQYKTQNAGVLNMDLFGAFGSSPFTGFQDFLQDEIQVLSRGDTSTFTERFTLNLSATAGSDFLFTFLAQGRGSTSQLQCDSTDEFTLSIEA